MRTRRSSLLVLAPLGVALLLCLGSAQARSIEDRDAPFAHRGAFVLPSPDVSKLLMEDAKSTGGPYRYGIQIPVSGWRLGTKGFGRWIEGADGFASWQFELVSPAAKSLDFEFSKLRLPAGATLILRGEGKDNFRTITPDQLNGDSYWSPYVMGERVTLELRVPKALRDQAQLQLGSVTHGYRGLFGGEGSGQKSGSCNIDTACSAGNGWNDQMAAVGQYTFSKSGTSYVCTGTLMANTGVTATPYFLTANHCMSTQTVASTIVVYWNYQGPNCRATATSGTALSKTLSSHNQSGSTLRATNAASDFTLLQLSGNVVAAASPFFAGWDRSGTAPTSAKGIHHPQGDEKRISADNNALTISGYDGAAGSDHWRVGNWESGTTEGGSSGSGLFNQNKLVVGQLHGGWAACGNTLSDYYGRLSVSWTGGGTNATRLSNWLDPGNTGATTRAGYRYASFFQNTTDYTINDNATVESSLTVSGIAGNAPSTLSATARITHTYVGDLKVDLVAPNGTVYVLHNHTGGNAANIYKVSIVNASAVVANGIWKLRVNDNAGGDVGFIDAFSLGF